MWNDDSLTSPQNGNLSSTYSQQRQSSAYGSENLPLKYKKLVLIPFGQHPRLTAVEQDWADQGLVNGEFCLA
jgi:hypothetical protein